MEDFFYKYAMGIDISNLKYDITPLKYYNPRHKGTPEHKTLSEMGFPYDVENASQYYNFALVSEFNNKVRAHWKRHLPEFKNNYLQYLLVFSSREKALGQYYSDCEPYGISQEEADNYLKNQMLFYLEPENSLEVIKELIFLILEYAPNDFGYFITCYGLKNSFAYKWLFQAALDIMQTKMNIYNLTPRVIQREIVKGTPLIDIYKSIFENKSSIKDAVKSFPRDAFSSMPYSYFERKIERILLSQSNLDYTIKETREGITFDYCLYSDGEFLFAIKYDGKLFSSTFDYGFDYEDDDCDDDKPYYPDEFEAEIDKIKAFDNECLEKGILVYHISDLSLEEYDMAVSGDIRNSKKDLNYLRDIIQNGTQYSSIRGYFREANEEDEDDEWEY